MKTEGKLRDLVRLTPGFLAVGLLNFLYHYLDGATRGHWANPLRPFLEEMTGTYGVLPFYLWMLRPTTRRWRPDLERWTRWAPRHVAVLLAYSFLHTLWNWGTRLALFALFGQGWYDYGRMSIRFLMEFPSDVIIYMIAASVVVSRARLSAARERELRIARLESDLAQAQLDALALQLHPHFLFNALNAVSAAIYEDPRKADIMLGRVADLLRRMLQAPKTSEVSLDQELETLELYLEVMKARFEEKLRVEWNVDASVGGAAVPQLILQPLVENAIRHGIEPESARVRIELGAVRQNGTLVLTVRDHGSGVASTSSGGIGLANTRGRLERLYGSEGRLDLENADGGGAEARIEIPFHSALPGEIP